LIVDAELAEANGYAERDTAIEMLGWLSGTKRRRTVGADKGYDTANFVAETRGLGFTPHVAQHTNGRRSAIDGRTTRHYGHRVSLRIRPRIEEPFGWIKTMGPIPGSSRRVVPWSRAARRCGVRVPGSGGGQRGLG
jgi:hypothetical protein